MKLLIAGAMLGAMIGGAAAADLPVKAQPSIPTAFPLASSGLYYGLYVAGAGGAADATNVPAGINAASIITQQGEIGGLVGYRFGSSNMQRFLDLECDLGYMNLNGATAGLSLSGPVAGECGARVGVPMAALQALFPSLGLPSFQIPLPAGTSVLATQVYVGGAARFEDISNTVAGLGANQEWAFSPAVWVGMLQGLSNGTALDGRIEYIGRANACVGPAPGACGQIDHRWMAKVAFVF